jgi:putative ABC transport system permease protein
MIALLTAMLRARRVQALTVWLLSTVAIAAAVAGPVALRTVDLAILRHELAGASAGELTLSVTALINPSDDAESTSFTTAATLVRLPGFDSIRGGELEAFGPVPDGTVAEGSATSRVAFRDRVCEHVTIVRGRCLAGPLEVIVGVDTAARVNLGAGDVTVLQAARFEGNIGLVPDGEEARLTVVGVYQPRDEAEAYWARQRFFPVISDGSRREAVFVSLPTFDLIDHTRGASSVDAVAGPGALTLDRLAGLPDEVQAALEPLQGEDQEFLSFTDIPALVDRIETSRRLAGRLVPVAFIPLVALCWFAVFIAVSSGTFGRRGELGLVTLRGVTPVRRWWAATGEMVTAILAAAPVGYLLGHAVVALVGELRLGGSTGAGPSTASLPYAALALVGALAVALLGQRRTLRESVVDLLRGVPRRGAAWGPVVAEVLVVILALVAIAQLRGSSQGLTGVALLVPGLVVVGVALLAARIVGPLAGLVARRSLRRGRLGSGLAAVQLARRPGSQRLFVLVAVACAMLAFVAAAVNVAEGARADRARIATGAARVLTVDNVDERRLLAATRAVDPDGAWAMAVMPIEQDEVTGPRVLGVDSTRLAAVAAWPAEMLGPAGVAQGGVAGLAEALRAQLREPFVLRGTRLELDLTNERQFSGDTVPVDVTFTFAPLAGGPTVEATASELALGRSTRRIDVPACARGCRLTGIQSSLVRMDELSLIVHSVRQLDPRREVVPADQLTESKRWRAAEGSRVLTGGGALMINAQRDAFGAGEVRIAVMDGPLPVPVVETSAVAPGGGLSGVDGQPVGRRAVVATAALPRLGAAGMLVDLEYLQRVAVLPGRIGQAEVWLAPGAPTDAAERLRAAGLPVSGALSVADSRAALARQGPALALHFHLAAAVFGVLLAVGSLGFVAASDRRRQAEDLAALRRQGLRRRFVRRAALWGYLSTVLTAALAGLGAAAAAWLAAGDRLPIFSDASTVLRPPRWPDPAAVVVPWAAAAAVVAVVAVVVSWALRRAVARGSVRSSLGPTLVTGPVGASGPPGRHSRRARGNGYRPGRTGVDQERDVNEEAGTS